MAEELLETTSQLPQVATDIGSFLINLTPGIVTWILGIALFVGVIFLFFILIEKKVISFEHKYWR